MQSRSLALLGSTLFATALGLLALRMARQVRAESSDLTFIETDLDGVHPATRAPDSGEFPYRISESDAERVFRLERFKRIYDPDTGFRAQPSRTLEKTWEEYPGGRYVSRTNSEGLADRELDRQAHFDLRVIAAGDSHTFGLCEREETWASELERLFEGRFPGRSCEVLNTGQGGYTFFQYAGALESFLDWDPQVFLLAAFAGNDFIEVLGLSPLYGAGRNFPLAAEDAERRRAVLADKRFKAAFGQCYSTLQKFSHNPEWIEPAIARSLDAVAHIARRCAERDVLFVTAVIPLPCCLEWRARPELFAELDAGLDLPADSCAVAGELVDRFCAGLAELGVEYIDLRGPLNEQPEPPFWERDLHLDLDGHELVAREFWGRIEDRLAGLLGGAGADAAR